MANFPTKTGKHNSKELLDVHNYVINETGPPDEEADDFIASYPNAPHDDLGHLFVNGDEEDVEGNHVATILSPEGTSHHRTAFVNIVKRDGMMHPLHMHNVLQNDTAE